MPDGSAGDAPRTAWPMLVPELVEPDGVTDDQLDAVIPANATAPHRHCGRQAKPASPARYGPPAAPPPPLGRHIGLVRTGDRPLSAPPGPRRPRPDHRRAARSCPAARSRDCA